MEAEIRERGHEIDSAHYLNHKKRIYNKNVN